MKKGRWFASLAANTNIKSINQGRQLPKNKFDN